MASFSYNIMVTVFSSLINQTSVIILWFLAGIYLDPEIIGNTTLLVSFLSICVIFSENVLATYIQKNFLFLEKSDISGLISISVLIGFSAIFISYYFVETHVYVTLFSLSILLATTQAVFRGLLEFKLDFKKISKVESLSTVFAFFSFVFFLISGFYEYSLIVYFFVYYLTKFVFFFPKGLIFKFSFNNIFKSYCKAKKHIKSVGLFTLLSAFSRHGDNFIVSMVYGVSQLGVYSIAYKIMLSPVTRVSGVIAKVLLPTFNNKSEGLNNEKFIPLLKDISLITFPLMFIVYLNRFWIDEIFTFTGVEYTVGMILSPLCIAGAAQSITSLMHIVIISNGKYEQLRVMGLINFTLCLLAFTFGSFFTIVVFAYCYAISTVIYFVVYLFLLRRVICFDLIKVYRFYIFVIFIIAALVLLLKDVGLSSHVLLYVSVVFYLFYSTLLMFFLKSKYN